MNQLPSTQPPRAALVTGAAQRIGRTYHLRHVAFAGGETLDDDVSGVAVAGVDGDGLDRPAKGAAPVHPGIAVAINMRLLCQDRNGDADEQQQGTPAERRCSYDVALRLCLWPLMLALFLVALAHS